ncbi:hypothetical protein L7F22_050554 [Adiantum nelumboides]|nr:hypothetical protein [Adiantum nelumboides]
MAFLVSRRDDEATKLRAFPLVLREGAKAWYQTLAPEERRDWETLKTAFIEEFHHQEPPEEIWRQLLELRQTSPNDYKSYEGKFSNLWEKWCASLGEGERAPECLKKDCFLAGLYPILREKVKVKFPDTFEKAMAYAREKDRKLKFQAQLQGGMEPPLPAQPIARTVAGTSVTDQESSQQELLQQITNQLESLSINLVQGVRAPQSGNDRNRQEGQRKTLEYVCYNCGEVGNGMYFCPHPRCYQGNGNHRRAPRQQVTPPRARPPNGQQNAPVAPPIQILRPPPPPPQTPAEIPPLPSGGEDRAVSVISTRLNFSSAYHPQTDGQSEIANLTVLDLLKAYVTEVDQRSQWEKYLPLVEYAYNNTVHTSTGKAPFEVIEGRSKSPLLLKVHGKIFAADEYSRDLKESFQKIKEAISIAQQKQKAAANKHRRALAFKENDWVLLKFPKARLSQTTGKNPTGHQKYYAKLAKRYYGPFQILKPINEMAYQLKLPNHWLIHNAFHVSLLKPYKGEPPREATMEDPPEVEGQEEVLQPESVLRHEDKVLRNGKIIRRYLIKFKNYPFEDAKWMQGTQLKDSLHLVNAYNDSLE